MHHSSYVTSLFSSRACCEEVLQPTLLTRKLSFGESESLVGAMQPVSEVGPHPALNLRRLLTVLTKNWSTLKPTSPSAQSSNRCLPPPQALSSPVATVCSGSDHPASFFQKGCVSQSGPSDLWMSIPIHQKCGLLIHASNTDCLLGSSPVPGRKGENRHTCK